LLKNVLGMFLNHLEHPKMIFEAIFDNIISYMYQCNIICVRKIFVIFFFLEKVLWNFLWNFFVSFMFQNVLRTHGNCFEIFIFNRRSVKLSNARCRVSKSYLDRTMRPLLVAPWFWRFHYSKIWFIENSISRFWTNP